MPASLPAGEQKAQVTVSKELSLCPVSFSPIAKRVPVFALLTQVPEKRGEVQSAHKRPILSQPSKKGLSPGGLCLLKFPRVPLYVRSGRGCGESFLNSPQVLWVG